MPCAVRCPCPRVELSVKCLVPSVLGIEKRLRLGSPLTGKTRVRTGKNWTEPSAAQLLVSALECVVQAWTIVMTRCARHGCEAWRHRAEVVAAPCRGLRAHACPVRTRTSFLGEGNSQPGEPVGHPVRPAARVGALAVRPRLSWTRPEHARQRRCWAPSQEGTASMMYRLGA